MVVAKETGAVYHLHKIILAYSSKKFASYFDVTGKIHNMNTNNTSKTDGDNGTTSPQPSSSSSSSSSAASLLTVSINDSSDDELRNMPRLSDKEAMNDIISSIKNRKDNGEEKKDIIEVGGPFTQYFQHVVKYL